MKLVLATSNPGKLTEFNALLSGFHYDLSIQSDHGVCDADENGHSFEENALIKARHASKHTGLAAIADDSGLEVDYLAGQPGIHSARYAGENASDQKNIDKLLRKLKGVPTQKRSARFYCVIAMVQTHDDPIPVIFRGCWEGYIAEAPCGRNGFGYDPVFFIPELGCTSAQLPPTVKNQNSHRAQALQKLRKQLL